MHKEHWIDYVKVSYDLVTEHSARMKIQLDHLVEAQAVHIFAKNMDRTDIGSEPIAIKLLTAMQTNNKTTLETVAEECLLIHSFPLKRHRWPTESYYADMGMISYGLSGNHLMETNFISVSKIMRSVFGHTINTQ